MRDKVVKVPQVMQMEALECGAACLAMILAYYGRWEPLEKVRIDCGVSRDGSKAINIVQAARRYGLKAGGKTFSTEALREKGTYPCILFWNFNHYVVLCGFRGKYAIINDPSKGTVKVPLNEFDDAFTGVTLVFEKTDAFVKGGQPPDTLAFTRKRLKGLEPAIAFVMLTAALTSSASILNMSLGTVFLDRVLTGENPSWLNPILTLMLWLTAIIGIVSVLNAVYLNRIRGKIAIVSSSRFLRHLLHLPVGFFSQRMVGDLQQRQSANESISFALVSELAPVLINSVMLVFYLVIMLSYSPLLTAVGMITVIINAILARYISRQRINISRATMTNSGKLFSFTVSGIQMVETIKAAGAERGYFNRWAGYQANVNEGQVRAALLNEVLGTVPTILTSLADVVVLVLGIWLIIAGRFTPGMLMTFTGFLAAFMGPVSQLVNLGQTVQEMQTQMERVEDVLRYEVDVPEDAEEAEAVRGVKERFGREKLIGKIDVTDVAFGYSTLEPPLIEGFDLHVKPGEWVALVGSSGSGKSTVAKLISGLYPPWSGEIRFDGVPLQEVPRPVLRGSLAVVDQDVVVFDDSVSNNVKLWDRSIEDYEVILACRDAGIHDVIISRQEGYSSRILPDGRNFSGGQLQRIEIARVLAQDPSIIILDEATSALDARTEVEVIKHIRDRGVTCIVVAHRLSTIRDCDQILVLHEGRVVERGTHEELLALDGAYADLVRSD